MALHDESELEAGAVRGRVLVVDDEPAFQSAIRRLLGSEYQVISVSDAADALALLRRGEWFDGIISDMRMPTLGGFELYSEIERTWPEQARRVFFITGGGYPHEESSLRAKGRDVLRKPSSPHCIRAALERVVGEPAPSHERVTARPPSGERPGLYSVVSLSERRRSKRSG